MKNKREIVFKVIVPNDLTEKEFVKEILEMEMLMNSKSKLRYHLQEPEDKETLFPVNID